MTVTSTRIAVVEADPAARSRLAMQLGDQVADYRSVEAFSSSSSSSSSLDGRPTVVVLGPSCAVAPGLGGGEDLIHQRRDVGAILIAEELTTDLFQRALRTGVRDVLAAPVDTAQLNEAVHRVASSLGAAAAPAAPDPVEPLDGELGRMITVFSPKGGAGKSTVATNLAVSLALRSEKPVVLVDADFQFGDVAVMLKLAPKHTIVDALGAIDRLDVGMVQNLLATHPPSGLRVLPAPLEPAYSDRITPSDLTAVLGVLRTFCAFVVVDTPSYFDDKVISIIDQTDDLLLVAGMDIPNIKNVKIGLQTMRLLGTPMSKVHLVLNRSNSKVRLDVSEVERTLQVKAESLIPSDVVVPQSVNRGTPVVLESPKSGVARALEALADRFAPAAVSGRKKRR